MFITYLHFTAITNVVHEIILKKTASLANSKHLSELFEK
jgi:hypothetical protein